MTVTCPKWLDKLVLETCSVLDRPETRIGHWASFGKMAIT